MIGYIKDEHSCRSKMIATYFNDVKVKRCGVCDNCLREKNISITKEEFEKIRQGIENLIASQPVNPKQLIREMPGFKQNKILKILHFLQEENIVSFTEDGLIKIKTG